MSFLDSFSEGSEIEEIFFVEDKMERTTRGGKPYLDLVLKDRRGVIRAKRWDWTGEIPLGKGDFVKVRAKVEFYNNSPQLNISHMEIVDEEDIDIGDFIPSLTEKQIDKYFETIEKILREIKDPYIRKLMDSFLEDEFFVDKLKKAPAAREIHHDFIGGLVKHISYMLVVGKQLCKIYRDVNFDLLMAGIFLHDIGKMEELNVGVSINYSLEGELVGHTVLGAMMVRDRISKIEGFPKEMATLIEHMIISHHGEYEFGAVRTPRFKEAMLLHLIDLIDSKMDIMGKSLQQVEEGELWSARCWAINNQKLLRIDRLLPEE